MPITNYDFRLQRGYEGMRATAEPVVIRTAIAATDVPLGRVLVQGTAGTDEARLPSATGQTPIGISVFVDTREKPHLQASNDLNVVKSGYAYGRLVRGSVYMVAETDIGQGSSIHYRHTAAGSPAQFDGIGRIRATAVSGQTDPLPNCRIEGSCKAGEVVEVVCNFI